MSIVIEPLLFDIDQAAARLNIPVGTLKKQVSARSVPFARLGKHVRFSDDHLQRIIRAGEQAAIGEQAEDAAPGQGVAPAGPRVRPRQRRTPRAAK